MCFQPLVSCVKMVFGKLLKTTRSQVGWLSNATKFRERCSVFGTRRTARVNCSYIILSTDIFSFIASMTHSHLLSNSSSSRHPSVSRDNGNIPVRR